MSKIMDIKGHWNDAFFNSDFDSFFNNSFDEKDVWEGEILVDDDGWFEGIVVDQYSSYVGDRLIFGIYHEGKLIELYKISPTKYPFVFHGIDNPDGFRGESELIGLFGPKSYGFCHIITNESNKESTNLVERIEKYKESNMNASEKLFYKNTLAMKDSLSKNLLRNYEGKGFTDEEVKKLSK